MMKNEALGERIRKKTFTLGVFGLGRLGLPLAIKFASQGVRVIGLDINEALLKSVGTGSMPFREENTQSPLREALRVKKFDVTSDVKSFSQTDAIIICVEIPLDEEIRPDFSPLLNAIKTLKPAFHEDQLILIRSTVSPGTLVNVIKPYIEEQTSFTVGQELYLAVCPERVVEGKVMQELESIPEIVGGIDIKSSELASLVFRHLGSDKQVVQMDSTSAELAKLFSNVYRYVRFALANEYAVLAEHYGVDGHQIIKLLNQGYPRGDMPLPGPCAGPHFFKDGYFLLENMALPDFILNAWKLNENIPAYMVKRLKERLKEKGKTLLKAKVGVLGMAYKAEVDDMRQSSSLRLIEILKKEGARVYAFDPFCSSDGLDTVLKDADAVVLMTNHDTFNEISPQYAKKHARKDCVFLDSWGMWKKEEWLGEDLDLIVFGDGTVS
jgi:UDP-N-acetyl-D-mannosaminuronic acid dehydrogenase